MTTTENPLFARFTDEQVERIERARLATKRARKMLPRWRAYGRMMTRNPKLKMELTGTIPRTDGETIWLRVPIELGDDVAHDRKVCGERDPETLEQRCPMCAILEDVNITAYHEVAHIVEDSFQQMTDEEQAEAVTEAIRMEAAGKPEGARIQKIRANVERYKPTSFPAVCGLTSPWLHRVFNAIEDGRVNRGMMDKRPGTKVMFRAQTYKVFEKGIQKADGTIGRWDEMPPNLQAIIGMYCKVSDLDYRTWLKPEIVDALNDEVLDRLAFKAKTARTAKSIFRLSVPTLERLRELGFCRVPDEPEDDPPPQPEPSDQKDEPQDDPQPGEKSDEGESNDDDPSTGQDDQESSDQQQDGANSDTGEDQDESDDSGEAADEGNDSSQGSEDEEGDSDGSESDQDEGVDPGAGSVESVDGDEDDSDDEQDGEDGQHDDDPTPADAEQDGPDPEDGDDDTGTGAGAAESADKDPEDGQSGSAPATDVDSEDGTDNEDTGSVEGSGQDDDMEDSMESDMDSDDGDDDDFEGDDPDDMWDGSNPEYKPSDDEDDAAEESASEPYTDDDLEEDGTPEEVDDGFKQFGRHDDDGHVATETTPEDEEEIERALIQAEYFDAPSVNVDGLTLHKWSDDDRGRGWRGGDYYRRRSEPEPIEIPERILTPALTKLRIIFADNRRGAHFTNLKKGRVNSRVLGKRVPVEDERLFQKKLKPGKKDYFVLIGLDISGSTSRPGLLEMIKAAAYAKAELCSRMGVKFAVYAHTGEHSDVAIYEVKAPHERWDKETRERLAALCSTHANLDGHTLEFYRKVTERQDATDKIILYYTDGAMPLANYEEELEILQHNILICKRQGIAIVGVGIQNDDPTEHGLDTIRLDVIEDVPKVVQELEKRLAAQA